MNKDDMLKYALIAGGAFAVYWYLTHYGSQGSAYDANGNKIGLTYWDGLFGSSAVTVSPIGQQPGSTTLTAAQQAAANLVAQQAACVAPNTWNSGTSHCDTPAPAMTVAQLRAAIQKAAGITDSSANTGSSSGSAGYLLSADQWNYYQNTVNPPALTGAEFGAVINALPAGVNRSSMTIDQFLAALLASGVGKGGLHGIGMSGFGDVVPVQSRPSVPMMSFGGAFNQPFQPKKGWS